MTTWQKYKACGKIIEILKKADEERRKEANRIKDPNKDNYYNELANICCDIGKAVKLFEQLQRRYLTQWANEIVTGAKRAQGSIYDRAADICSAPDNIILKADKIKALNAALRNISI